MNVRQELIELGVIVPAPADGASPFPRRDSTPVLRIDFVGTRRHTTDSKNRSARDVPSFFDELERPRRKP